MRVAAAYLGALPVTETNCVTKPFQPENCPNWHPTKICGLHSSEGIEAFVNYVGPNVRGPYVFGTKCVTAIFT